MSASNGTLGHSPICTHCSSSKSPLWRRGQHGEILCNACGLYWKHHGTYRPLSLKMAAERKETLYPRVKSPPASGDFLPAKRDSNLRRLKAVLGDSGLSSLSVPASTTASASFSSFDRKKMMASSKKGSAGKISIPSTFFIPSNAVSGKWRGEPVFVPELPPSAANINVHLVPAEVRASEALDAPIIAATDERPQDPSMGPTGSTLKYMMLRGKLVFLGDHVAVRGDDQQVYFAIIHDFWMTPLGQKYVHLQWLLPRNKHALQIDGPREQLDPSFFTLGPMHDRAEPIGTIIDVFFSPQLLRRPIEGPSTITPTRRTEMSTLRRSSSLDGASSSSFNSPLEQSKNIAGPQKSSGRSTPSGPIMAQSVLGKRPSSPMSDSEMDLYRPVDLPFNIHTSSLPNPNTPSFGSPTNILDDVEIAHLLCSMI